MQTKMPFLPLLYFALCLALSLGSQAGKLCQGSLNQGNSKGRGYENSSIPLDAMTAEQWIARYSDFKQISIEDTYFRSRMRTALAARGLSLSQKQWQQILSFSDRQNQNFAVAQGQAPARQVILALDSSYLKVLNDQVLGKESATSLNFFFKSLLITRIVELATETKDTAMLATVMQSLVSAVPSSKHNDYKSLVLAFSPPNNNSSKRLRELLNRAYADSKVELQRLMNEELAWLQKKFLQRAPSFLRIENLYNAVTADKLLEALSVLKEARKQEDPFQLYDYRHGQHSLQNRKQESFERFYQLQDQTQAWLGNHPKIAIAATNGLFYPRPVVFKMLRRLASSGRQGSERSPEENTKYYQRIQLLMRRQFQARVELNNIQDLVAYFHQLSDIIPPMLHTKTTPLEPALQKKTFLISFDYVNGGGTEMHLVAKELAENTDKGLSSRIEATYRGVDLMTAKMQLWASTVNQILRKNFAEVELQRSGDDMIAVFAKIPKQEQLQTLLQQLAESAEVLQQSRITYGLFGKGEAVLDAIGELENIEKEIEKKYSYRLYDKVPQMPVFAVERGNGIEPHRLQLLQPASELQLRLLEEILQQSTKTPHLQVVPSPPTAYPPASA